MFLAAHRETSQPKYVCLLTLDFLQWFREFRLCLYFAFYQFNNAIIIQTVSIDHWLIYLWKSLNNKWIMSSKLRDYLALYSSNQYKTNCTIDYSYYSFAISASWRRKEWFKYTEKGTPFLFHKARYLVDRKELLTLSYKVYLVTFTEFIILDVFKQETSSSLFACRWQTSAFYFALAQYISSLLRKDSDQSKL